MDKMELIKTKLEGVYIIENQTNTDIRGQFIKIFNEEQFKKLELPCDFKEVFYTFSHQGTIRGMHFQNPPFDHEKLVFTVRGQILDVVLDIRPSSKTYKQFITVELNDKNQRSIYIPKGCAHGYIAQTEGTIVAYHVTSVFNKEADDGIRYDSFGMDWPIENPILSSKDQQLLKLQDYKTKFE